MEDGDGPMQAWGGRLRPCSRGPGTWRGRLSAPRKLHGRKPPADRRVSSPFFPLLHPQLGPSLYCLRSLSSVPLQVFREDSEA